ncbi:MAG: hypothetical protein RIS76_251 [Verrucomicrobiota bacterium]
MRSFLTSLTDRLSATRRRNDRPRPSRSYRCSCGRPVFFRNSQCLGCHTALGYLPETGKVRALRSGGASGRFRIVDDDGSVPAEYVRCGNFHSPAGCNWMVPSTSSDARCIACRLNRTIPDLTLQGNGELWRRLEFAKRRLVAQLLDLGLPVKSRVSEDLGSGLMFDFLRSPDSGARVLTGHHAGLITINIEEADDSIRERMRHQLREPYRTLLGHFRHEVGHYFWDRLVVGSRWWTPFRDVFGDERADYAAALRNNYESGPRLDWPQRHVSAYASIHPWEDWAETWAHYLHVVDTLNTALGFGLDAYDVDFDAEPFPMDTLFDPQDPGAPEFLELLNSWVRLTGVVNELTRSMGQPDLYPFVLSKPAVRKLHFVHTVVTSVTAATRNAS